MSYTSGGDELCNRCGEVLDMSPCDCGEPGHEDLATSFCPHRIESIGGRHPVDPRHLERLWPLYHSKDG